MAEEFDQWAIVEIFGHQVIAGKVTGAVIGGQGFVRIDVPAVGDQEGFTKFYGTGAIYSISPVDEETCKSAVAGLQPKPVEVWKLNLPQLQVGDREDHDDENDFDDNPY
jgi:hypothetical protein